MSDEHARTGASKRIKLEIEEPEHSEIDELEIEADGLLTQIKADSPISEDDQNETREQSSQLIKIVSYKSVACRAIERSALGERLPPDSATQLEITPHRAQPEPKRMKSKQCRDKRLLAAALINYVINEAEQTTDAHPIDAFVYNIKQTVKAFPPSYQHLAKTKIFRIVSDIELELLMTSLFWRTIPAMEVESEVLKDDSACSGVRYDLKMCLLETDCVKIKKKTPRECLQMRDVPQECVALCHLFYECKRSLMDNRTRFRGIKGY